MGQVRQDTNDATSDALVQHPGDDRSGSARTLPVCEITWQFRIPGAGIPAARQNAEASVCPVAGGEIETYAQFFGFEIPIRSALIAPSRNLVCAEAREC